MKDSAYGKQQQSMKPGDLVREHNLIFPHYEQPKTGVVLEVDISMWGEEEIPSGIRVMWSPDDISVIYSDELTIVSLE